LEAIPVRCSRLFVLMCAGITLIRGSYLWYDEGDGEHLRFSLAGSAAKAVDIVAVLTDDIDQSNVLRSEISGKALLRIFVARSLSRIATLIEDADQSVHLSVPPSFQRKAAGHHLVLFAQVAHEGVIVGRTVVPI
jgi:hypothetical protein